MIKLTKDKTKDGRHIFKRLTFDGHKVAIDKDIAPLLAMMWKLGIRTTCSCQSVCSFTCNHKYKIKRLKSGEEYMDPIPTSNCNNSVWLAFESCKDVELFYNIVAEYSSDRRFGSNDAMYHKMCCDRFVTTGKSSFSRAKDGWSFEFIMRNSGVQGHWGRPTFGKKRSTQEMWIQDGCEKNDFVIEPQITFPRTHLKYVESRLEQALKQGK